MDTRNIFENKIKIEPIVMSIEVLFNSPERLSKTNYTPFYQRNYVWDDEKATYFIESILLGTEIPPLIYFRNSLNVEVIDGRQRYQTILRFINNEFKLKKNGLRKLDNDNFLNKSFKDLDSKLQDLFWETKLRIIEFSFHVQELVNEDIEDIVKKEIFNRYNSGITPLKSTEIDNAKYDDDSLNSFFKDKLINDKILSRDISNLLHFEKTNNEIILKKIRQLLVLDKVPIKYYGVKKDIIISKFYEHLYSNCSMDEAETLFSGFIQKMNFISKIKESIIVENKDIAYNRLITECLFWAFSILEVENKDNQSLNNLLSTNILDELSSYIIKNITAFELNRSSFAKELFNRYEITSKFFSEKFDIAFTTYLLNNNDFKQQEIDLDANVDSPKGFEDLRINKPEPSSIAIMDICRQMDRNKFLMRPTYQRKEVINKKKSSSIIESILLGIKLPPIFVFKREDGITEVIDGQQRLLSILGFIKKPYLDENGKVVYSEKNGFALNLKNGILQNLNRKNFESLTFEQQEKIKNFNLWIVEINYKNNSEFEPIDLFLRLNEKPYPIKEDTFELWNSYISRDIITTIKGIYQNNKDWFYIRKSNTRMENENIYTALAYFQYNYIYKNSEANKSKYLDFYKVTNRINFRVTSKNEITKVLENPKLTESFLYSANHLEFDFIRKIKKLISDSEDLVSISNLNKNLDYILNIENGRRTQLAFYALWYFLYDISTSVIIENRIEIAKDLRSLFLDMTNISSRDEFVKNVNTFKLKFQEDLYNSNANTSEKENFNYVYLGEIANINNGISLKDSIKEVTKFKYLKKGYLNKFKLENELIEYVTDISKYNNLSIDYKDKILVSKNDIIFSRFGTLYTTEKLILGTGFIGIEVNRSGFLTKYILSILSSRYSYYAFFKNKDSMKNDFSITISDLKDMKIPWIEVSKQKVFIKIVDYILEVKDNLEVILFFERLLDALTYEIVFQKRFEDLGIHVYEFLKDLKCINKEDKNQNIILSEYQRLSDPNFNLNVSLLRILNIPEVIEIEQNN